MRRALGDRDVPDAQHGLELAVAALAAVVLAPPLLEDDHLGGAALLEHLGRDPSAIDQRRPDLRRPVVVAWKRGRQLPRDARQLEAAIKALRRADKERLVAGDLALWRRLRRLAVTPL